MLFDAAVPHDQRAVDVCAIAGTCTRVGTQRALHTHERMNHVPASTAADGGNEPARVDEAKSVPSKQRPTSSRHVARCRSKAGGSVLDTAVTAMGAITRLVEKSIASGYSWSDVEQFAGCMCPRAGA
jgi:hypothetical protein